MNGSGKFPICISLIRLYKCVAFKHCCVEIRFRYNVRYLSNLIQQVQIYDSIIKNHAPDKCERCNPKQFAKFSLREKLLKLKMVNLDCHTPGFSLVYQINQILKQVTALLVREVCKSAVRSDKFAHMERRRNAVSSQQSTPLVMEAKEVVAQKYWPTNDRMLGTMIDSTIIEIVGKHESTMSFVI